MIIRTKDGWKDFVGPTPSEARVPWFLKAKAEGYKFEQTYANPVEDERKTEAWLRKCFLALHTRAFPAGMHAPGVKCTASEEKAGCPFDWTPQYLAAI